jgi:predicted RND superfamily exporter protein
MYYATETKLPKQVQSMTAQINIQIAIAIQDPDLDNEELQEAIQNLREQIEESEIVETVDLVAVAKAPEGSKAFGGFILGLLY